LNLEEFRESVYRELGPSLEGATYEKVRLFLDRMQATLYPPLKIDGRIVLGEERDADFDSIVLEFFANSLRLSPEQAVIGLWLFALEIWFSSMEEFYRLPPFSDEESAPGN
jgi:hypothetical protein